jgi:hypothetical protein
MKTTSKIALIAATLLLALGGVFALGTRQPDTPPEELIRQSLQDAENAARNRNASGVIEVISDDFQAGMWNRDRLRLVVIRSIRSSRGVDYDVRVNAPRILPSPKGDPDQRVVISKMAAFYSGSGDDIWGSGPLTMVMRKESRRKWLLFSEPRWRVVSIANVPPMPLDDAGGI